MVTAAVPWPSLPCHYQVVAGISLGLLCAWLLFWWAYLRHWYPSSYRMLVRGLPFTPHRTALIALASVGAAPGTVSEDAGRMSGRISAPLLDVEAPSVAPAVPSVRMDRPSKVSLQP